MQRRVQAGPLSAIYDSTGGDLRDIRFQGALICLRIYAAIRDEDWGTVPGTISNESIEETGDAFTIRYTSTHKKGAIDFTWQGTIRGSARGAIFFSFDGEAHSDFRRNRIGFCVLHPMQAAGLPCTLTCTDRTPDPETLPLTITPDQPPHGFTDLIGLTHSLPHGGEVEFTFIGDAFEMEDQRNWTDASFKTFCTPLSFPFPVEVHKGEHVQQSVTMRYHPIQAIPSRETGQAAGESITLVLRNTTPTPFPEIGLGVPQELPLPDEAGLARLKALGLAHLRIDDFHPNSLALANALGLPVELAVHGTEYTAQPGDWARVLALPSTEHPKERPDHAVLLEAARAAFPDTPVFLGTDSDFLFLNRFTPEGAQSDGFTFAITPQIHAFDRESIIETAEAQGVVVTNARRLADGKPVIVSPVTLLPRWNPYAATPQPRGVPAADPRQGTPFCAAWTLASLKYLAAAGAASVTLYETHGTRGVLGTPTESLLQQLAGASTVLPSWSSNPLRVEILAFERDGERVVLAANLTSSPQEVLWDSEKRTLEPYAVVNL
ncbi:MAG: hypothetical protein QM758_02935 [Armatimonas sp.]